MREPAGGGSRGCRRGGVQAVVLTACLVAAGVPRASGQQRPIVTEDPETIGAGHILLEGGIEFDSDVRYPIYGLEGDLWRLPSLGVSIGLSSIAEFQIDSGYSRLHVTRRGHGPACADPRLRGR